MKTILKNICTVTEKEKLKILSIFERLNGLEELLSMINVTDIIIENKESYMEKIQKDINNTQTKYHNWWNNVASKYKLDILKGNRYMFDFDSNIIKLPVEIYE